MDEVKAKRKPKPKWAGPAMLTVFVVGCLCMVTWLFFAALDHFLGEENTFGDITISPFGYNRTDLLHESWDSIIIKTPSLELKLAKPEFRISRSDSIFLAVKAQSVTAALNQSKTTEPDTPNAQIPEIPNISIFFKVGLNVDTANIQVQGVGKWHAEGISLQNSSRKDVYAKINSISGTHLEKPIKLLASSNWDSENLFLNTKTISGKDTIAIAATAPRKNVTQAELNTEIQIARPKDFFKQYPDEAPAITNLAVKARVKQDSSKHILYNATINADLGERWPLPPMHATITANGNENAAQFKIVTKSSDGGTIELQGAGTKDLNGEIQGSVSNISAEFGPEEQPLDLVIHSAQKVDNVIHANVTTKAGSHVKADIQIAPDFRIDYTADIAAEEPWAVKWSGKHLKFDCRPQIVGEFSDGEMRSYVRFGKIANAYFIAADSMHTHLSLNQNGIHFNNSIIYGKHDTFDFVGEVMWDDIEPHTSWEVTPHGGGKAKARVNFEGPSIEAEAENVLISTIPFGVKYVPEWIDARVTGTYHHDFDIDTATAVLSAEADIQMFHTFNDIVIHKHQDTVILESAEVRHEQNKINLQGAIVLPDENRPAGTLPVEILNAWVSTRSFSIPLSLLPLGDSTFSAGEFSGDLSFTDSHGLRGNIEFANIEFRDIPKELLTIKQMSLFAERTKAELDAYLEIGSGVWDGHTQITFDQILGEKKHFSFAHITNSGGNILGDGYLDSNVTANIKMDGYWLLPEGVGELRHSDLSMLVEWELARGLNGLQAKFSADSIVYAPLTINYEVPVKLEGKIEDKKVLVTNAVTHNTFNDSIAVNLTYAFDQMRLLELNLHTDEYRVKFDEHNAMIRGVDATLAERDNEITIDANIPELYYNFNSETFGEANAKAHGDLHYHIPKNKSIDIRTSNFIEGNIIVDKMIYQKDIDIEISPSTINQMLSSLQNTLSSLRRNNDIIKNEISKTNSTNLKVHVANEEQDSVFIKASFAEFPFALNFDIQGTVSRPTLRGEVANAGEGFVGFKGLYEFNLQSFLISWAGVPWQQGILEISISQDLPYCTESADIQNETCPVNIDVNGTITNPLATPSSYCGTESSTASIYYNIFLGCIAEDPAGESVDWNKLAGTAIGKVISTTANKTLGGNYIGNIDMKMRIFSNTETLEEDSSYVKIPISLDKWINNLSIVLGYTQDQSENPTYEQAFEFGINYKLPVFQEAEYSHSDHLNPELSVGAMLVSKQYHVNSATQEDENQLEKNIGVMYGYRFWSPCLFGLGKCNDYEEGNTGDGQEKDKKENAK